jgi:hypothetical protein
MFLVGVSLFFKVDKIPGGWGDAVFNMYVLEHGYRWLMHLDSSFWSAPFFYPAPNVITYSDNHLGSLLFYFVFRIFGAGRETALQLWAVTIFALNYFVTWLVLQKQNFHPIGAIGAAYLFTFGPPMAAQIDHIQLAPRLMVPVAFWMALRFLDTGRGKHLCLFLAACVYQIYLGIYIGYFLLLSVIPFVLVLFAIRKQWTAVDSFLRDSPRRVVFRRVLEYVISCVAFVLMLLPLAIPYYDTQQSIGRRTWEETLSMLPRWQSYLYGPYSLIWGRIASFGATLPMSGEHMLFPGILPYLAVAVFIYLCWRGKVDRTHTELGLPMVSVLLVVVVLTLCWSGFSLYYFVWKFVPGAGGIRAVSRIILVLLYPSAVIFGLVMTHFLNPRLSMGRHWKMGSLSLCVLALLAADQAAAVLSMSKYECKRRIARLEVKITQARRNSPDRNVLWVNENNADSVLAQNLDAMLAGQALGINVVNGYSGLWPKGYPLGMALLNGDCCNDLRVWAGMYPGTITNNSLIEIGRNCQLSDHECTPLPIRGFGAVEVGKIVHVWAIDRFAELQLPDNPRNQDHRILSLDLATFNPRSVKISTSHDREQTVRLVPGRIGHVDLPLSPRADGGVELETDSERVKPSNGDPRRLFFDVENLNAKVTRPSLSPPGLRAGGNHN